MSLKKIMFSIILLSSFCVNCKIASNQNTSIVKGTPILPIDPDNGDFNLILTVKPIKTCDQLFAARGIVPTDTWRFHKLHTLTEKHPLSFSLNFSAVDEMWNSAKISNPPKTSCYFRREKSAANYCIGIAEQCIQKASEVQSNLSECSFCVATQTTSLYQAFDQSKCAEFFPRFNASNVFRKEEKELLKGFCSSDLAIPANGSPDASTKTIFPPNYIIESIFNTEEIITLGEGDYVIEKEVWLNQGGRGFRMCSYQDDSCTILSALLNKNFPPKISSSYQLQLGGNYPIEPDAQGNTLNFIDSIYFDLDKLPGAIDKMHQLVAQKGADSSFSIWVVRREQKNILSHLCNSENVKNAVGYRCNDFLQLLKYPLQSGISSPAEAQKL